jgi:hypothetical protein
MAASQGSEDALIDPERLGEDVRLLGEVRDPLTPDERIWLFRRGDRLIIRTRREAPGTEGQRELPFEAALWLHHAITARFWRPPEEGGLPPRTYHLRELVGGEVLELRRAWGLGPGGEPGFTLTDFSRLTAFGYPQEITTSDELLIRGGLLELLARLVGEPDVFSSLHR